MVKMSVKPQYKEDGSCNVFDVNSKYLHKKFKKMAETAPVKEKGIVQDDTATIKGLVNSVNRDANSSVNGQSIIRSTSNDLNALREGVKVYDKKIGACEEHLADSNESASRGQNVCTQCKFECAKYGVPQKCTHEDVREHPYQSSSSKLLGRGESHLTRPCGSRDGPVVNKSGGNPSDRESDATNHNDARPLAAYSSNRDASGESLPPPVSRETNNNNQDYSKQIYKPKFKVALHYEEGEVGSTCETKSSIFQPSNCVIVTSSMSNFGSQKKCEPTICTRSKSPSSPGTEHSPRRVNNPDKGELNVDESDPVITDTMYRDLRRDVPVGQPSSFISISSHFLKPHLPLGASMLLPATNDLAHNLQLQSAVQLSSQSKLAVAFRPLDVETASLHSAQPLNLSAPNNTYEKNMAASSEVDIYYRKRSHPEEFSSTLNYVDNKNAFHSNMFASLTPCEKVEKAPLFNGGSPGKLLHSLQNPEGRTIKDLLLKAGEKAQAVGAMQGNLKDVLSIGEVIAESGDALITNLSINSPNEPPYYNCAFCKSDFESAAALIIHQRLQCRLKHPPHGGSVRSPHHSPDVDLEKHFNSHRNISSTLSKELQPLVMPIGYTSVSSPSASLSSPGPVLGNTLLIAKSTRQKHKDGESSLEELEDKLHTTVTLSKRQRLDLDLQSSQTTRSMGPTLTVTDISGSVTSLRKVEDSPKFTAHQNSRGVYDEVQIVDSGGKAVSLLGNASSRPLGSIADVIVRLPSHLRQSGFPIHASTPNEISGDTHQHVIVSSESQLDSAVINVARETSSSSPSNHPSANVFMSLHVPGSNRPVDGHQRSKSSSPVRKPSQITIGGAVSSTPPPPFSYSPLSLLSPNTASTMNLPTHMAKHLVSVPPTISAPNLTASKIPVRTLGQHVPFMPFLLGLSDFTLVNSLNHVTPSNPQLLPETLSCSKTSSLATSQDSGGALTILHKGKHIPYVPGMPGPQTLLPSSPVQVSCREETVSEPLDLASPSKEGYHQYFVSKRRRIDDISILKSRSNKEDKPGMYQTERCAESSVTSESKKYTVERKPSVLRSSEQSQVKSLAIGEQRNLLSVMSGTESKRVTISLPSPVQGTLVMQTSDNGIPAQYDPAAHKNSKSSKPPKYQPIIQSSDDDSKQENTNKQDILREENNRCESKIELSGTDKSGTAVVKFHRPNSLPLKPETFVPKKHFQFGSTPGGTVVLQVSPETPRSRKSFGQLYLQGNVFTFLNLKISTRPFFCILTRTQPMYVMQTPENPKLSMYSNWRIKKTACPNPLGLSTEEALSLYDSRNRCRAYTTAKSKDKEKMIYTHSSYWFSREHLRTHKNRVSRPDWEKSGNGNKNKEEAPKATESEASSGEPPPRKAKIFGRGFESKDDYTYVKGRGRGRYVCNDCGIRCLKPSMLRNHIRTHTNIRPYICRHCNFSFKTKGNLTKHMKSKAHYKKCIKLCIFPVPTVVDDSYIDEECFAQQQVAQQGESGDTDSEDNEEEDDEEDDDKESEEVSNDYSEHEAAHSLLSLSEPVLPCSSLPSSGLAPASSYTGRPSTYPYVLSVRKVGTNNGTSCGIPQSPGLTPVCAQMERETVLRNTSLALELGGRRGDRRQDDGREMSTMVYRRDDAAPVTLIPRQQNDVSKYHRASELTATSYSGKRSTDGRSMTDKGSDADDEYGSSISCSEDDSETSGRKEKPYSDVDSYSTASFLQPIDLSTKNTSCTSSYPRKAQLAAVTVASPFPSRLQLGSFIEVVSPFPGQTTVISSPNSLLESSPVSNQMLVDLQAHTSADAAETNILHKYLTKREVQNAKLHQQSDSLLAEMPASPAMHAVPKPPVNIALATTDARYKHSQKNEAHPPRHQFPPSTKLLLPDISEKDVSLGTVQVSQESPRVNCDTSTSRCGEHPDRDSDKHGAKSTDRAAVGTNDTVPEVPSANCDSSTKNRVISRLGFSGESWVPSLPVTSNAADPEAKAEFLPPSTRPLPAYVRVMEDGQSMCIICNKVFSKPSQLRLHINIHCLEHPFKCELCAVSFRKKGHLKKHESSVSHQNRVGTTAAVCTLTTTNPRPFKCDDCNIAFRIHGHLAKHLRSKMHIMKLECIGKLPFGTYEEMERDGFDPYDIDTTDCENSLESLQVLAQRLHEKDPTKLGHWGGGEGDSFHPNCPSPVTLAQRSRDPGTSVQAAEATVAPASDGPSQHDPVEAGRTVQEFTMASSPPCRGQHM